MNTEEKKAFLLLKSVIFNFHGLDESENKMLENVTISLDAKDELRWATNFIAEDYYTAFERARVFLNEVVGQFSKEKKLSYLEPIWKEVSQKGYITEMEASALLKLAKDWQVEMELIALVKKNALAIN